MRTRISNGAITSFRVLRLLSTDTARTELRPSEESGYLRRAFQYLWDDEHLNRCDS